MGCRPGRLDLRGASGSGPISTAGEVGRSGPPFPRGTRAPCSREALALAVAGPHDVLVVDRMLPSLDGLSLVKAMRAAKVPTPAPLPTALGAVRDRSEGLKGGDDYRIEG